MSYAFSSVVMYQGFMRAAPPPDTRTYQHNRVSDIFSPLISFSSDPSADSSYIKNSNQLMISNTPMTNHSSTAVTYPR